jgi:hypothetical protein
MPTDRELIRLEAEARHARDRYRLYKARAHGRMHSSPARLRELESSSRRADTRLRRARTVPEEN